MNRLTSSVLPDTVSENVMTSVPVSASKVKADSVGAVRSIA